MAITGTVIVLGWLTTPRAAIGAETGASPAAPATTGTKAPEQKAPEEKAPEGEGASSAAQATETCKQTLGKLVAGDLAAVESLKAEQRLVLTQNAAAENGLQCLAIAHKNSRYCNLLRGESKDRCARGMQHAQGLDGLPKEQVKAEMLYRQCVYNSSKADCEAGRKAWTSGNASQCASVKDPTRRTICTALASGDAAKCASLTDATQRGYCEALSTDNPDRCPKDADDCKREMRGYARLKQEGLEGFFADFNPSAAAAQKGKQGCQTFLPDWEKACDARPSSGDGEPEKPAPKPDKGS